VKSGNTDRIVESRHDDRLAYVGLPNGALLQKGPIMNQPRFSLDQRSRFVAALLSAILSAGCQPAGTGSIEVNGASRTVRDFITIEPAKRPSAGRSSKQPAGTKSSPRTGFQ
jgi:hypothetical protein